MSWIDMCRLEYQLVAPKCKGENPHVIIHGVSEQAGEIKEVECEIEYEHMQYSVAHKGSMGHDDVWCLRRVGSVFY